MANLRGNMKNTSDRIHPVRTNRAGTEARPIKKIILAVDDMPGLLSATVKILKPHYTVVAVTSAQAALKAIEKPVDKELLLHKIQRYLSETQGGSNETYGYVPNP